MYNKLKKIEILPYKMYEVLVPLSELRKNESYWIRTAFNGAVKFQLIFINNLVR